MREHSDDSIQGKVFQPTLDRLLRFDRHTEARYEAEHGAERVEQLRNAIVFGILLYVLHGISKVALFPASMTVILSVTAFVVVPFAVAYHWWMGSMKPGTRENMMFFGVSLATILPVYMMNNSFGMGLYSNVDVLICVIFGNVLVALSVGPQRS